MIDYDISVYKGYKYQYIRIKDLKEEDRGQLERWIFGSLQPLIYDKGIIQDAIFLEDYQSYLKGEKPPLTTEQKYDIIELSNRQLV